MLHHLDNPEAMAAGEDGDKGTPTAAVERTSLLLLAAVLEVDKEAAAVARRVEKRLAKDNSSISIGSTGSLNTTAGAKKRASAPAFEYRAKALAKDAASEDGLTIGRRLVDAVQGLLEVKQAEGGEGGGGLMIAQEPQQEGGSDAGSASADAHREAWKALVARFCRAYLGRAVQSAESGVGSAGPGDPLASSSSKWQQVLTACAAVERAVGRSGLDEGWIATAKLLASAYAYPNHDRKPEVGTDDDDHDSSDNDAATALELRETAKDVAGVNGRPWLKAEACLHLAGLALWGGDVAEADTFLKTASAAAAATRAQQQRQQQQQQQQRRAGSNDGGIGSAASGAPWAGALSGPSAGWRELALRCLVDERLGTAGAGDATAAATLALDRVDAAIVAFNESFRLRGAPAGNGGYADVHGGLGLARASLMLKLGRLEEARSAVDMASAGALHVSHSSSSAAVGRSPCLHCGALCVASELDLSEGETEHAKGKLREVLDADPRSADALSRLGWLLLGFGGRESGDGNRKRVGSRGRDVQAARPLLERAVAEEPGCSSHAFRLARFVLDVGLYSSWAGE